VIKRSYLEQSDVDDFIKWFATNVHTIPVSLNIKASRFVPTAINVKVKGFQAVHSHYCWKSVGTGSGSWASTLPYLATLSKALQSAVSSANDAAALAACRDILIWGGCRSWKTGAWPFLNTLPGHPSTSVCDYILTAGTSLALTGADTTKLAPPVLRLNAMLSKVHALYAADGLPIYDSRVAAAISSLVEYWRVTQGISSAALPPELDFPATLPTRMVSRLFPKTPYRPSLINYISPNAAGEWASASVRLGWIMEEILARNAKLFGGTMQARMHAFEASLFMIGYDVRCLACALPSASTTGNAENVKRSLKALVPKTLDFGHTISTLNASKGNIFYAVDAEGNINVIWGDTSFQIPTETIDEILDYFAGRKNVPLGASQTGPRPSDSLGQWLLDNGWPSARYASAIAAILVHLGLISRATQPGKGIRLDFPEVEQASD